MKLIEIDKETKIRELDALIPIHQADFDSRILLDIHGKTIGDLWFRLIEESAWIDLRMVPAYQGYGLGTKALRKFAKRCLEQESFRRFLVNDQNVSESGKAFLSSLGFVYNDELHAYERILRSLPGETNQSPEDLIIESDVLTATVPIDVYFDGLVSAKTLSTMSPVEWYLKGLANIDYFTATEALRESVKNLLQEQSAMSSHPDLYQVDTIRYYASLLSQDEKTRLSWLVYQLREFSVFRITGCLLYDIPYSLESLTERDSIIVAEDASTILFNPILSLVNGLWMFHDYQKNRGKERDMPHWNKLASLIEQDRLDEVQDLASRYEILSLNRKSVVDAMVDTAYRNKAFHVMKWMESKFKEDYHKPYVRFSVIFNAIQSEDFEFATTTAQRLYPEESLANYVFSALNLREEELHQYLGTERIPLAYVRALYSVSTFDGNQSNLERILERKIVDWNEMFPDRALTPFTEILEKGSKELIELLVKHGADLMLEMKAKKSGRVIRQFVKVMYNPNDDAVEWVMNKVGSAMGESIEDIVEVAASGDEVEQLIYLTDHFEVAKRVLHTKRQSILDRCIRNDHFHMFKYLIRNHYGYNAKMLLGTVLFDVIEGKKHRMFDFLIESEETQLDIKNPLGVRPIIRAIHANNPYAVKALYEKGVRIEDKPGFASVNAPYVNPKKYPAMHRLVKELAPKGAQWKDTASLIGLLALFGLLVYLFIRLQG